MINSEEQDATIKEELEHKKLDLKPSHASLLDISNIGFDEDSDADDTDISLSIAGSHQTPFHSPLRRGMSLPPLSPTQTYNTPFRDTVSVSRDSSPTNC